MFLKQAFSDYQETTFKDTRAIQMDDFLSCDTILLSVTSQHFSPLPNWVKIFHSQCYLVATVSTQPDMCTYTQSAKKMKTHFNERKLYVVF
jgi:hypothetical protein